MASGLAWTEELDGDAWFRAYDRRLDNGSPMYTCRNGHERCALDLGGRCYQDEVAASMEGACPDCRGTGDSDPSDPFGMPCNACHGSGRKGQS